MFPNQNLTKNEEQRMLQHTNFDELFNELKSLQHLNQQGYNYSVETFALHNEGTRDDWDGNIDGVASILKNHAPSNTMKLIVVRG